MDAAMLELSQEAAPVAAVDSEPAAPVAAKPEAEPQPEAPAEPAPAAPASEAPAQEEAKPEPKAEPEQEPKPEQPEQPAAPEEAKPEPEAASNGGAEAAANGASVSDEDLKTHLQGLLMECDLAVTTEKMLRKQLEDHFGCKLGDKKALIKQQVTAFLAEAGEEGDAGGDGDEDERPAKRSRGGGGGGSSGGLSPEMAAFLGVESMKRTDVVSALWDYIKANNLQDPKDRRQILLDDKLSTLFTAPLSMFSINKQLSRHCFNTGAVTGGGGSDGEDGGKRKRGKAAGSAKKGKAGQSGFQKPVRLSDELAALVGKSHMARGTFMKWIFKYCDDNNLKDPSDRRYILADDKLKSLTGESRFQAFSVQKLLKPHFLKDD